MLFTIKDLQEKEQAEAMLSHPEKCVKYISELIEFDLSKAIGTLTDETSYHFDTGTRWNLHDLIVYLVRELGPCHAYLSTYAIKEYQARLLTGMKADGLIKDLYVLLDYRNTTLAADAVQLLEASATSVGYTRTHSKLTVLVGEKLSCTITGSANLTVNTTADTGVITVHKHVAAARMNWIINHIKNASNA